MEHWPFIWSSYAVSAVILIWTALAPLMRQRTALRNIRMLQKQNSRTGGRDNDANP